MSSLLFINETRYTNDDGLYATPPLRLFRIRGEGSYVVIAKAFVEKRMVHPGGSIYVFFFFFIKSVMNFVRLNLIRLVRYRVINGRVYGPTRRCRLTLLCLLVG